MSRPSAEILLSYVAGITPPAPAVADDSQWFDDASQHPYLPPYQAYDDGVGIDTFSGPHNFSGVPAVTMPEGRRAVHTYLESLLSGLGNKLDWNIDRAGLGRRLLVPALTADGGLLAVRAFSLDRISRELTQTTAPYDDAISVVDASPEWPDLTDVPTPFEPGAFDQDLVWVCRDPADAYLLREVGVYAVSLATPSKTLGSVAGLQMLDSLGALSYSRARKGTLVVVDYGGALSPQDAGRLLSLYERVYTVFSVLNPELPSLTGHGLARSVRNHLGRDGDPEGFRRTVKSLLYNGAEQRFDDPVPLPPILDSLGGGYGAPRRPLTLVRATELAAKGDTTPWIAKPFVASRAITDFQGPVKEGKTTFLLSLVAAIAQGTKFLGRECRQSPVVYVSEQTEGTILKSAKRANGITEDVHFLTLETMFGSDFEQIVRFVRRKCRELKARVVVFDTLGPIAGLWGDSENQSGTARQVYRALRVFSVDGVGVVVVRHSRKARGTISETGSGSVAFSGEADQLVRFTKPYKDSKLRRIEVVGRLSVSKTLSVRLRDGAWEKTKDKRAASRPAAAGNPKASEAVAQVLSSVGAAGATYQEIVPLSATVGGMNKPLAVKTVEKEVSILVKARRARREEGVVFTKARVWLSEHLPSPLILLPSPTPPLGGGGE